MPDAKIWYWPTDGGSVESITIPGGLSDLQERVIYRGAEAQPDDGVRRRITTFASLEVRVVIERLSPFNTSHAPIIRQLIGLENHLQRGLPIMLSADSSKGYAAVVGAVPAQGATTLTTVNGNELSSITSGTLAADDEVMIESGLPDFTRELNTYASASGFNVTVNDAIRVEVPRTPAILRYRWFYPLMSLPLVNQSRALMTGEHGITYTFDATLHMDVVVADILDTLDGLVTSGVGPTLQDAAQQFLSISTDGLPEKGHTHAGRHTLWWIR